MSETENKFLENYRKKLIKEFSKCILKNFKVTNSDDINVNEEDIIKVLCNPKIIKRCIGITSSGVISQCTRNAIDKIDYCKTHMYKIGLLKDDTFIDINYITNDNSNVKQNNLKKKFINDSFYNIDNEYIYDINTNNKVGYIYQSEYILTSDPFILNNT